MKTCTIQLARTAMLAMLLLCCARHAQAQVLRVDSLELHGYRVHVYKPQPVRTRTIVRLVHDTIREVRYKIVTVHDTIRTTERIVEILRTEGSVVLPAPANDRFALLLVGNANTNGYGMHLGAEVWIGERICFFIGGGMGYNSVTKFTHLDLAGLLTIRLWERPD